jgi:demethylmenaquinone methyltransferase/2-methoxy-6-polyprenyl-1,4-benzoquinol methylase
LGHVSEEWRRVVGAIEESIPLYEWISERISFNLAGPLRRRGIHHLNAKPDDWVLDSGAGPGVSSRLLITYGFVRVAGLDPSRKLLRFAKSSLGPQFHPVVGVAENLPFIQGAFDNALTCFALRDVRELSSALAEFSRVVRAGGRFSIVDVGKPDGFYRRALIGFYVRFGMPILARLLIRNRIRGNPFRMIVPTFNRLVTNQSLESLVRGTFGPARLREYMLGGLVLLETERIDNSHL